MRRRAIWPAIQGITEATQYSSAFTQFEVGKATRRTNEWLAPVATSSQADRPLDAIEKESGQNPELRHPCVGRGYGRSPQANAATGLTSPASLMTAVLGKPMVRRAIARRP